MTHTDWSIRYHQAEIDLLRCQLRPCMILAPDDRLDIERRIGENEQWVKRWTERRDQPAVAIG
jgi:hypothetical protein